MLTRAVGLARLAEPLDLLVIGGGVTGAAVLFEAARRGLHAALVERHDFASGTSSKSSKLIHGGLRYLREGRIGLVREALHEREALLREAPGLVEPMPFLVPFARGQRTERALVGLGLRLYDRLAGGAQHRWLDRAATLERAPILGAESLEGAYLYGDATTDDARLVLRLLQEADAFGAVAMNYADATPLLDANGTVCGARVVDAIEGTTLDVRARATICAAGVFSDAVRAAVDAAPHMRPLRGSHLVLPDWRLPLASAVAFAHPRDGRPVFAYPWEGATLVGTTDLDHAGALEREPRIAPEELTYLIEALHVRFPRVGVEAGDVIATFAGIRPVVGPRAGTPGQAHRDHIVWNERGLITIAGGKMTTFRPMALAALRAAAPRLPAFDLAPRAVFAPAPAPRASSVSPAAQRRLAGRYGARASDVLAAADGNLAHVAGTPTLWAELHWSASHEAVVHLDDLLLRRTRIGLLLPNGGAALFERIGAICARTLRWDAVRYASEVERYRALHADAYGVPA